MLIPNASGALRVRKIFNTGNMKFHLFRVRNISIPILIMTVLPIVTNCKKNTDDMGTDAELYAEVAGMINTYYRDGNLLTGVSPSPHGDFRLRFNPAAASVLDTTGEIPAGNSFPTGSILVKEIYSDSILVISAVMKKDPGHINSGSGWLWAEFNADGSTAFSTGKKGEGCIACHSTIPNRDLVKTFDLH